MQWSCRSLRFRLAELCRDSFWSCLGTFLNEALVGKGTRPGLPPAKVEALALLWPTWHSGHSLVLPLAKGAGTYSLSLALPDPFISPHSMSARSQLPNQAQKEVESFTLRCAGQGVKQAFHLQVRLSTSLELQHNTGSASYWCDSMSQPQWVSQVLASLCVLRQESGNAYRYDQPAAGPIFLEDGGRRECDPQKCLSSSCCSACAWEGWGFEFSVNSPDQCAVNAGRHTWMNRSVFIQIM
eukprot:6470834-Amphidinium_carterae.2